jgi:chromosome segregation ATPase
MNSFDLQPLESRTLFSLVPHLPPALADNATLQADRTKLHDDVMKYRNDFATLTPQLQAERQAVVDELTKLADNTALQTTLAPLKATLKTDRKARNAELRTDLQAIEAKHTEFLPTLRADRKAIRAAINDPTALATAKAKLTTDRAALDAALAPLRTELSADKTKWSGTLAADRAAILAAEEAADPALAPLVDKLQADQTAAQKTLADDRAVVAADRAKLAADIAAALGTTTSA